MASIALLSAARLVGPLDRNATEMLYAALPDSIWFKNQSRCWANDSGEKFSCLRRGICALAVFRLWAPRSRCSNKASLAGERLDLFSVTLLSVGITVILKHQRVGPLRRRTVSRVRLSNNPQ